MLVTYTVAGHMTSDQSEVAFAAFGGPPNGMDNA